MNAPTRAAIIAGSLVDAKNVAQHKCLRLTIDVPAELAMHVIETLGWPTQVSPIPVAVARLVTGKEVMQPERSDAGDTAGSDRKPSHDTALPSDGPTPPTGARKPVAPDKRMTQRAAITCTEPKFWAFIREQHETPCSSEAEATDFVRTFCGVNSRKDIVPGSHAAHLWDELHGQYLAWEHVS